MIKKSIWIYHLNTGGCNGCDIEIIDVLTPFHDAERLGVKLVGSPRHADVILLTGPITRQSMEKAINAITAAPDPKFIVAIGSCACGGGIWYDSYATVGGIEAFYKILRERGVKPPKVIYVPGCPPRPEAILHALAYFKGLASKKIKKRVFVEK
ncbi:MAG: NADH:ubiquinone oxidoreductase [Thaumarchaeota archaeon]|nr:NADH:ubiquinone oxidoreductase [Nitrososphaerota archaeon]